MSQEEPPWRDVNEWRCRAGFFAFDPIAGNNSRRLGCNAPQGAWSEATVCALHPRDRSELGSHLGTGRPRQGHARQHKAKPLHEAFQSRVHFAKSNR